MTEEELERIDLMLSGVGTADHRIMHLKLIAEVRRLRDFRNVADTALFQIPVLEKEIEELTEQVCSSLTLQGSLFQAIAHGDDKHRQWLEEAILAHFEGLPVPAPYGKGSKERLQLNNERLLRVARAADKLDHWGRDAELMKALDAAQDLLGESRENRGANEAAKDLIGEK